MLKKDTRGDDVQKKEEGVKRKELRRSSCLGGAEELQLVLQRGRELEAAAARAGRCAAARASAADVVDVRAGRVLQALVYRLHFSLAGTAAVT